MHTQGPTLRFTVGYGAWPVRPGDPLEHVEELGYFDWAGRRLFLADGSPDPDTSGAYRYQHSPECCDLEAWDGDPISPRYEPMYLRHRPGDTWLIDADRPHDPDDSGPFGTPGWRPDLRTGRHRRNELPDPIPPGFDEAPEPEWTEVFHVPVRRWSGAEVEALHAERDHDEARLPDGRCRANRRRDSAGAGEAPGSAAHGNVAPPFPRSRSERAAPSPAPRSEETPSPEPKGPSRFPSGDDRSSSGRFWNAEVRRAETNRPAESDIPQFSRMREQAFSRFLARSAELHAAHYVPAPPDFRERLLWWWRLALWVLAVGTTPMPKAPWATRGRDVSSTDYRPPAPRSAGCNERQHGPRPVVERRPVPYAGATGVSHAGAADLGPRRPELFAGAPGMARALSGAARYRRERANPPRPARIGRPAARPFPTERPGALWGPASRAVTL